MFTLQPPKKILVLGNGASGKSTLAKYLSEKLSIPLLHLDTIYWENGWQHADHKVFLEKVSKLMKKNSWIIEGTPMLGIENRMNEADTIFYLDVNRWACLWRALKRYVKNLFVKNNYNDGCPANTFSLKTFKWIYLFEKNNKNKILNLIKKSPAKNKIFISNLKQLAFIKTKI